MHTTPQAPAKVTSPVVSLKDDYVKTIPIALIVGAIGLAVAFFTCFEMKRFMYIYLTNFCFVATICIGSLFFVLIMHLTRAGWSVTVRRIAEIFAMCLLPMFLLFLPILIPVLMGSDIVYPWVEAGWSEHGAAAEEIARTGELPPMEVLKVQYLNPGFFGLRVVIYFAIWAFMAWYFLSGSLKQDKSGDKSITARMQAFSAPAMIVFAATLVFASFDFEMSLSPLWFSTMFPVYFFAGSMLSALATITLTAMLLQRSGRVTDEITTDHYHDLAKLMFAFVFFWGYIGFSQFMLIWYANIPEETFWFNYRINPGADGQWIGWQRLSLILLFGHLIIPFLALMARTTRRSRPFMFCAAIYILAMHWCDHYWLIMPQYSETHAFTFNPLPDIACAVGMIGLMVAIFCAVAGSKPLVPLQDPRLKEALDFKIH